MILMDMSFMSKFLVQGRDAGRVLNHISANNVDGDAGPHHLHAMAQRQGHARSRPDGDQARRRTLLRRRHRHHAPPCRDLDASATFPTMRRPSVTDVTSGYCQINMQGPRSRELLQTLTSADLSNEAFPFRTAREIDIGFARVAVRPHHLCRRTRIRALHSGRAGHARLRPPGRSRHARSACATPA